MRHHNLQVTGSINVNNIGVVTKSDLATYTGSAEVKLSSLETYTGSTNTRLNSIESISASNISRIGSLESFSSSIYTTNTFTSSTLARLNSIESISASNIARINSLETTSASVNTLNSVQNARLDSLENKSGSLATTGSNTFIGTQVVTGSLYVTSNLIVQGSSSIQNITGSSINIGTNTVVLNTANPAVRYAGISVIDSGSTGLTGSILWDSTNNNWLYQNPSGSSYTSAKFIAGPQSATLGAETGLNTGYIPRALGDDHIGDSLIFQSGSRIGLGTTQPNAMIHTTGSIWITDNPGTNALIFGSNAQGTAKYSYITSTTEGAQKVGLAIYTTSNAGTSNEERVRITDSGYVGIGSTAPSFALDIYGATSGTTSTLLRLKNGYNDTSTGLRVRWDFASLAGAYLDVTTDSGGTKSMTLYLSAANAAPSQVLTMIGSTGAATFSNSVTAAGGLITKGSSYNVNNTLKFLRADNTEMGYIGWSNESTNNSTWLFKSTNGNTIGFSADGTNQNMVVTTGGNVGIGTTNPAVKLDVAGALTTTDVIRISKAPSDSVQVGPSIYFVGGTGSSYSQLQQGVGRFIMFGFDGSAWQERLTIHNSSGGVGIGTTSPAKRLDVYDSNGNATAQLKLRSSGNTSAGYLGTFANSLYISAGGTYDSGWTQDGSNGVANVVMETSSGGSAIAFGTAATAGLPAERMRIMGNGYVGIGVTNPGNRLQVSGNIYSTDTVFGRNIKPEAWASITAGSPSGAGIPLGYSMITINTPCDGNWRTILSNINDTKAFFWVALGDAASKDTACYTFQMTSPAYGVSNMANVSYMDGGWNTGGFEFTYSNANGTYTLLVRATSYYSSGSTAYGNIYFLRME